MDDNEDFEVRQRAVQIKPDEPVIGEKVRVVSIDDKEPLLDGDYILVNKAQKTAEWKTTSIPSQTSSPD